MKLIQLLLLLLLFASCADKWPIQDDLDDVNGRKIWQKVYSKLFPSKTVSTKNLFAIV